MTVRLVAKMTVLLCCKSSLLRLFRVGRLKQIMTVIMAIKRNNEVWLGSDTRITCGIEHKVDCEIKQDCKLILLDHAVIGAAGDLTMRNLLELFITRGSKETIFETKLDVVGFFLRFKKFLKRHAGLGESEQNQVQNLHNTG